MKKIGFLLVLLVSLNTSFAQLNYVLQGPEWISNNTGSNATSIKAIDSKSNAAATKFYHLGQKNNGSNNDLVLACVNATGGTDWEITYDGGGNDNPVSLAIDNSGNLYCFLNSSVSGIMKGRIIKYNSAGTIQWNNTYGGLAGLTLTHGIASSSGVVYFTGFYAQTSTQSNIITYKLTTTGTTTWSQTNNASGFKDESKQIAVDASGNVYVAGLDRPSTSVSSNWRMIKYSSSGTLQYALSANYSTSSVHYASTIVFDNANNVYFGGISNTDAYYRKYSATGTLLFSSSVVGYITSANPMKMITDISNNLYVATYGMFSSPIVIQKISSANSLVWSTQLQHLGSIYGTQDAPTLNRPKALLIDEDSSYLYIGIQGASKYLGNTSYYNYGFRISRVKMTTGVYDEQKDNVSHASNTYTVTDSSTVTGMFFTDYKQGIVIAGDHVFTSLSANKFKTIKYKTFTTSLTSYADEPSYLSSSGYSNIYSCGNDPHLISVPDSIQLQPSGIYPGFTYFWIAHLPNMTVANYLANPSNYEANTNFIVDRYDPYTFFHVPSGSNPWYRLFITSPGGDHFLSAPVKISTIQSTPTSYNLVASGPVNFCPGDSVTLSWPAVGTGYNFSTLYDLTNSTQINFSGSYVGGTDVIQHTYYTSGQIYAEVNKTFPANDNQYSGYDYLSSFPGCIYVSDTISITAQGLSVNLGADQQVCAGQSITLNAGNGYSSYAWNTGATTQSISPTTSGIYGVTVSNGSGCTAYDEVNITILSVPTISAGGNQSICSGNSATLNASGASTYVWDNGLGSGASHLVSPTSTTTYNVVGTAANGCQNSGSVTVTVNALPNVQSSIQSYVPPCPGNVITLNASGAQTYTWQPMNVSGSSLNYTFGTANETLTLTGTDANGCSNQFSIPMTVSFIDATVQTTNATCGSANGSAQVIINSTSNTITSYNWGAVAPSNNTANASSIASGSYVVEITNADACTFQFPYTIGSTGGPVVTVNPATVTCPENTNGSLTAAVSGGTAPYTYSWSNGQTTASANGLSVGNHTVTVTDQNGCQNVQQGTVSAVNASPNVQVTGPNQICTGSNLSLTASGAQSYVWNGSVTGSALNFQPIISGTVTVVGTDANGCSSSVDHVYSLLSLPAVSVSPDVSICSGNSTNLNASGAQTYSWTPGPLTGSAVSVSPLANTTYTVTGTDANGCQNSAQVLVTVHQNPTLSGSSNPATCGNANGTAQVIVNTGQAPYTYAWINGATTSGISNVTAGTYSVVVTDANACSAQTSVIVSNTGVPVAQLQMSGLTCADDTDGTLTANVSGGVAPYTYLWNTGATTATISNLFAGTYAVQVTDANGCVDNQSLVFTAQYANPTVSILGNLSYCQNASVLLQGQGADSYVWSTGGTAEFESFNLNSPITVTVTGTDVNGCTGTGQLSIGVNPLPVANEQLTDANCNQTDGAASVNPSNGTAPYSVVWSTGATTLSISNLAAGNYSVQILDANNCSSSVTVVIANIGAPDILLNAGTLNCHNDANGSASAVISGGNPPYQLLWSTGETTTTIQNLAAGNYTVQVTDALGCISNESVSVDFNFENPLLDLGMDTTVCNETIFTLTGTAGMSNYDWSDGSSGTTLAVTQTGVYSLVITDANGCTADDTVAVTFEECLGVDDHDFNLSLFPNPTTNGLVHVESSEPLTGYTLYDASGRLILQTDLANVYQAEINLENQAMGWYRIILNTAAGSKQFVLVKH